MLRLCGSQQHCCNAQRLQRNVDRTSLGRSCHRITWASRTGCTARCGSNANAWASTHKLAVANKISRCCRNVSGNFTQGKQVKKRVPKVQHSDQTSLALLEQCLINPTFRQNRLINKFCANLSANNSCQQHQSTDTHSQCKWCNLCCNLWMYTGTWSIDLKLHRKS